MSMDCYKNLENYFCEKNKQQIKLYLNPIRNKRIQLKALPSAKSNTESKSDTE
jgi:hypothetical protein